MSYKLGKYLRELRGSRSLRDISKLTNEKVSHSYISDLERGTSRRGNVIKPSPEKLQDLAKVYNVDYSYLMELAGYVSNKPIEEIKFETSAQVTYPVIGTIKAGPDGLAYEDYQGTEPISKTDVENGHDYFWLVVSGESMTGDGIFNGDYALIKRTQEFNNGDICAVIVDNEEGTLKHVTKSENSIVLSSSNPLYPPRVFIGEDMNKICIAGRLSVTKRKY